MSVTKLICDEAHDECKRAHLASLHFTSLHLTPASAGKSRDVTQHPLHYTTSTRKHRQDVTVYSSGARGSVGRVIKRNSRIQSQQSSGEEMVEDVLSPGSGLNSGRGPSSLKLRFTGSRGRKPKDYHPTLPEPPK